MLPLAAVAATLDAAEAVYAAWACATLFAVAADAAPARKRVT